MAIKTGLKRSVLIILMLAYIASSISVVLAAEQRASTLIVSHSCTASADADGKINVTFSITGKKIMSRIGAQSMSFYIKNGTSWKLVESYTEYYVGMSAMNKVTYDNTITYQGTAGADYKVVVTLFAKNSDGETDSRTYTKYV